ncbi:hypothetical protein B1B_08173, partial [mine drainage metagenome]
YKSEALSDLVSPHCTYSNDITVEAGIKRFIHGRSCSEISSELNNSISERHVRNLSNMAGDILVEIHDRKHSKTESCHEFIHSADRRNNGFRILHD